MEDDSETGKLVLSVRQLSSNIDAAALELGHVLDMAHVSELQDISVLLCNAADAIEDPNYAVAWPSTLSPGHSEKH